MGLQSPSEPRSGTRIRVSGHSEAGRVRSVNQDSFFAGVLPGVGALALVADGMGGHKTGEVASQQAVEIVRRELERARTHPPAAIARAVQTANLEVYTYATEYPEHRGMGTTLTAVLIDDQVGLVGHVGDSRAYLVRDGAIRQLTHDHSWVAERVRQGVLTEDEAKKHRWRNVITNALGATAEIKLDIHHFEVRRGDRLIVLSDGVSMLLPDERLLEIAQQHEPEEAVKALIEESNERGSPDNITAVVMEVAELEPRTKRYDLPAQQDGEPRSVALSETMTGIRKIEEAFPGRDLFSKMREQPWYPYRVWVLGSLYLVLLILLFSVWGR